MEFINKFRTTFWSTDVWLPPNTTWEDIAPGSRPDVNHADYRDLVWPLPLALLVMLTRYSLERYLVYYFYTYFINKGSGQILSKALPV